MPPAHAHTRCRAPEAAAESRAGPASGRDGAAGSSPAWLRGGGSRTSQNLLVRKRSSGAEKRLLAVFRGRVRVGCQPLTPGRGAWGGAEDGASGTGHPTPLRALGRCAASLLRLSSSSRPDARPGRARANSLAEPMGGVEAAGAPRQGCAGKTERPGRSGSGARTSRLVADIGTQVAVLPAVCRAPGPAGLSSRVWLSLASRSDPRAGGSPSSASRGELQPGRPRCSELPTSQQSLGRPNASRALAPGSWPWAPCQPRALPSLLPAQFPGRKFPRKVGL